MTGGAAFVGSDIVHEVDATEGTTLIVFFDPESYLGVAFSERITVDIGLVAPAEVDAWRDALAAGLCSETVNAWLTSLVEHPTHGLTVDSRIHIALAYLKENIANPRCVSLSAVAAHAGLSASRFMHLFTATVGVPLRPYILWLRLQVAAGELIRGATASKAAHLAGFSDSAHLTRTFRRMLGVTPSKLAIGKRVGSRVSDPPDLARTTTTTPAGHR